MAFRSVSGLGASRRLRRRRVVDSTKAGLAMRFPSPIRFLADRRGNVAMMYALMLPVLMFGAGFAVDYTHAMQVQTKLDAAADAAVLAALTPSMMQQSNTAAQTAATNLFTSQANNIGSLVAGDTMVTVTVVNPNNNALDPQRHGDLHRRQPEHLRRRSRLFGARDRGEFDRERVDRRQHQLLSAARQFAVDGPAGRPGGHQFDGTTSLQPGRRTRSTGCAFACHQASTGNRRHDRQPLLETPATPARLAPGRRAATRTSAAFRWTTIQLARANNITLRIDELNSAVTTMMATAQSTQTSSTQVPPPVYRFAAYSIDSTYAIGSTKLMSMTTSYVNRPGRPPRRTSN